MKVIRHDIDPMGVIGVMWERDDGTPHRGLYAPGDDVSSLPDELQAVARETWTDDILAAWQADIAARPSPPPPEPDPRDAEIAELKAAMTALKKRGVLTDAMMIDAERAERPKKVIPKSVIVSRLIDAGKIGEAYKALNSQPEAWAKWVASDRPAINYDDPDAIALLKAIGADPEKILAP